MAVMSEIHLIYNKHILDRPTCALRENVREKKICCLPSIDLEKADH